MSTAYVDTAHQCLQHTWTQHINVYSIRGHNTSMSTAYMDTAHHEPTLGMWGPQAKWSAAAVISLPLLPCVTC
eukprot:4050692-Pyramimonas_sp.AAC.1